MSGTLRIMRIVQGTSSLPIEGETSLTIGFFDGVHLGHQAVIRQAVEVGVRRELTPAVVTFDRHPLQTLSPGKVPPLLTTLRRKAELIERLGVEILYVLEFSEGVSRWSPEEFVDRVLVDGLRARHIAIGANFTFGHRAAGNFQVLTELGETRDLSVEAVDLFKVEGRPVSSTSIREALSEGDLEWPRVALGRPYLVEGTVVAGAGRGRGLGWPTANLRTPSGILLPGRGVYAGVALLDGVRHPAAINVGVNPTFGEEPLHVEAYVLDLDRDLLGMVIGVEFHQRLRDEQRFSSAEELALQMGRDVALTREVVADAARGAGGAV